MGSPWAISSPLRRAHDTSAGRDLIGRSHCHAGPRLPAGVRALEKDPTGLLPISWWAKSVPTESLRRLVPCHADPARAQCCSLWLPCAWRRARPGLRGGTSPPLRAGWGSSPRRAVSHWPHGSLRRRGSVRGRLRPPRGGWAPGVARTAEGLASARRGGSEDPHAAPAPLHRRHLQRAPSAEAQRRPPPRPLPEFIHQHRALRLRQVLVRARISVQLLKLPEPQSPGLQNQKSHCLAGPSDGRCGSKVPGVQPGIPIPRAGSGPGQTITPSCDWHAKAFPALLPGPQTQTSPVSTGHPTGLPRQSPRAHPGSRL